MMEFDLLLGLIYLFVRLSKFEDLGFHNLQKCLEGHMSFFTQTTIHMWISSRISANSQIVLLQMKIFIKAIVDRICDVTSSKVNCICIGILDFLGIVCKCRLAIFH